MNNDNDIKLITNTRLSELTVSSTLKNKILSSCVKSNATVKRIIRVAAVFCLCVIISLPVIASKIPAFHQLLNFISPQVAQILQPIELISENNGISMEVVAAMNDDDIAVVYLTLKDNTAGNRIDETVDLYDYSVTGTSMYTHELIDYDEKTNTATIRMIANGGSRINDKKITVRVKSFLSGKEYTKDIDTGLDLNSIKMQAASITLNPDHVSGSGGGVTEESDDLEELKILKPLDTHMPIPGIDMVKITNIGYLNGTLHVQTKWQKEIDNHGFLFLRDANMNVIKPKSIAFGFEDGITKYGNDYVEYVFSVDPKQIGNYSLLGEFVKNNYYTEGDWQTTFKIRAVDKNKIIAKDIKLGDIIISTIKITPMGINITGDMLSADDISISVTMSDGKTIFLDSSFTQKFDDKMSIKYLAGNPINIVDIKEVRINNKVININ